MIHIVAKTDDFGIIKHKSPNAILIDFKNNNGIIRRLNPYFPYKDIPVPNSGNFVAESIGAIWHGLKVFEKRDIDRKLMMNYLTNKNMCSQKYYVQYLGHRYGVNGLDLLSITDARRRILIPTYKWMLDYKAQDIIQELRKINEQHDIVFLEYFANSSIQDYSNSISYVSLIKAYVEGSFPCEEVYEMHRTHHSYIGRKYISWTTCEKRPKTIEPYTIKSQIEIPFDIV